MFSEHGARLRICKNVQNVKQNWLSTKIVQGREQENGAGMGKLSLYKIIMIQSYNPQLCHASEPRPTHYVLRTAPSTAVLSCAVYYYKLKNNVTKNNNCFVNNNADWRKTKHYRLYLRYLLNLFWLGKFVISLSLFRSNNKLMFLSFFASLFSLFFECPQAVDLRGELLSAHKLKNPRS